MQNGPLRGPRDYSLPNTIMEDTGRTALHEAATIGDEKTLNILLSGGSDRNIKDLKHGNTPLHEAAWRGFSRCVKSLCALPQPKNGKDVKEGKIKGVLQDTRGALHSALLGTRNGGGFSALHLAAQNGHNQSCREILLAGADPDVQNNYGDSPLHTACRYGHAGATRILISAKGDPNRNNLNGDTPLHIACAMGRRKLTRILLEAGSNIEMKNAQTESPRDIAVRKNLREILEILSKPVPVPKPSKERDRSSSNSKSADKVDGSKSMGAKKKTSEEGGANPANWSPYGCHYFPDPRSFPSPKLETLPKEPLGKGEQYFLDLAGNIRKGPIGVGNTCYCGPFFRHIEERISRNRKSIRKYVHKATERLDNKVQALALRTDDQIEQLTRSMIADRIRCEGRRLHLEEWLRRGEPGRLTIGHHSKSKKNIENVNTLTRCRSLELLDDGDNIEDRKMQNSRSFDMLDEPAVSVPRGAEAASSVPSSGRRTSKASEKSKESSSAVQREEYSVSERLEELLAKTNEILEMERIVRRRRKDNPLASSSKKSKDKTKDSPSRHLIYTDEIIDQLQTTKIGNDLGPSSKDGSKFIAEEMEKITSSLLPKESTNIIIADSRPPLSPEISKDFASQKEYERKSDQEQERSSILSESSHRNPSSAGSGYVPDFSRQVHTQLYQSSGSPQYNRDYQNIMEAHEEDTEIKFKNLITALRKDYHSTKMVIETELVKDSSLGDGTENNSPYSNYEQSTSFDDDQEELPRLHEMLNGFYQNSSFDEAPSSSSNTLKSEKRHIIDQDESLELSELANVNEINELKSRILNGSNWRSQVLKKSQQMVYGPDEAPEVNGMIQKVEIKNSEIKTLKSPTSGILKRSKVQELVAKIQGVSPSHRDSNQSESSEDEQDEQQQHIPNGSAYYYNRPQPQVPYQNTPNPSSPAINNVQNKAQIIDTHTLIPKDAYFHELPNKNRMRPIADKLPEKQLLDFTDHFQTARTRNPLPYVHEYEIGMTEPNPIQYIPHREKLLTNRKFTFSSAVDYELSRIHINQQQQQQHVQQTIFISPEQAQIERDMNNDSGYSTKICGSSHGPSPSLSGHTDYGIGLSGSSGGCELSTTSTEPIDPTAVPYFLSNLGASSLV